MLVGAPAGGDIGCVPWGALSLYRTTRSRAGRLVRAARAAWPQPAPAESPAATEPATTHSYEFLYEAHARSNGDDGVGGGDYDVVGEIEFDVLRAQGLEPTSTLLDFGCGNGRLAVHVVPYLTDGHYVGTDIAETFLEQAGQRLRHAAPPRPGAVRFVRQVDLDFGVEDHSIDMLCAFSVFTHMDHEDMYRYLNAMHRIVRTGGRVVLSCLPLDLADAKHIFRTEAGFPPDERWNRVRNVTTSTQLVDTIAEMAGWSVVTWLPGSAGQAPSATGEMRSLGQSIVVLTH